MEAAEFNRIALTELQGNILMSYTEQRSVIAKAKMTLRTLFKILF